MGSPTPLACSIPDAARVIGVHPRTVRRMIDRGDLPVLTCGRRSLVPCAALERYVTEHTARRQAS